MELITYVVKEQPFLAFIALVLAYWFLTFPFRLANRWIRHRNIAAAGWPPRYLDADGDRHDPSNEDDRP